MNALTKRRLKSLSQNPFEALQREVNLISDHSLMDFDTGDSIFGDAGIPAVDVQDKGKAIEVSCEIPGVDKKDIDISVSGDVLAIRGERKGENEEKRRKYYRRESWNGEFYRRVALPGEVDSEKARAEMKNGILKLNLPKKENGKQKKIAERVS